jgi:GNAT superfamily N-acetyltransferase
LIYIHEINVRPGARRKGVGRMLLDAAKEHGRSLGIPWSPWTRGRSMKVHSFSSGRMVSYPST